jgi:uroporphyrinogen decarboxylase
MTYPSPTSLLTHRERVLNTFRFLATDHPACDLMEGCVWPELLADFSQRRGCQDANKVQDFLDTDFRWAFVNYQGPSPKEPQITVAAHSKSVSSGPLANAITIEQVNSLPFPDPTWWQPADYVAFSRIYPQHARVLCCGWTPLFWGACEAFGMENALVKMATEPKMITAFIQRQHEFYMDILTRCAGAANGWCDLCWLGDDVASQQSLLVNPNLWRALVKTYLAEQVQVVHQNNMKVLFHSCGAVRTILPDLIDIGIDALLVFQTTARGMDARSIARDFGGKLVFYGGVDIQRLLSSATPEMVTAEVVKNIKAFEPYGGYIVANSHHSVDTIKGENIEAMCRTAQAYSARYPSAQPQRSS